MRRNGNDGRNSINNESLKDERSDQTAFLLAVFCAMNNTNNSSLHPVDGMATEQPPSLASP